MWVHTLPIPGVFQTHPIAAWARIRRYDAVSGPSRGHNRDVKVRDTSPPPPKDTPLWRYGPPIVILLMLGVILYSCGDANTGNPNDIASRFPEVEKVIPSPDSEVLRQNIVGIDLIDGWSAVLFINGTRIPEDEVGVIGNPDFDGSNPEQADGLTALNRFQYQPLSGRSVEILNGDVNCVRAEIFPTADPGAIKNVEWCFTAA